MGLTGTKYAGESVAEGTTTAGEKVVETAKIVGEKAKQAAQNVWEATKEAAHDIKETVVDGEQKDEAEKGVEADVKADRGKLFDDEEKGRARNKDQI